jgi:hypothetical protein
MQRPRLTKRTAEALNYAVVCLNADPASFQPKGDPRRQEMERALEYLEDLLRWHRSRVASPDDGPA